MFLYAVPSQSVRAPSTQQESSTVSFLAVLVGRDRSAELGGFGREVLIVGPVCLLKILALLAVLTGQATVFPQDGDVVIEFGYAQY